MDSIKDNIDIINNFSSNFYAKINVTNSNTITMINNISNNIDNENKNYEILDNIEKKISDKELVDIFKSFINYKIVLNEKYNAYNNIIDKNRSKIVNISTVIKENKEIIDNVYNIINELEKDLNAISNKITP
jgi:uncharacterized coiled-coil DUF342 family protein